MGEVIDPTMLFLNLDNHEVIDKIVEEVLELKAECILCMDDACLLYTSKTHMSENASDLWIWEKNGAGATEGTPFTATETPVSYTHLDVYKRQY